MEESLEFAVRGGLFGADAASGDGGPEIIFAAEGGAVEARRDLPARFATVAEVCRRSCRVESVCIELQRFPSLLRVAIRSLNAGTGRGQKKVRKEKLPLSSESGLTAVRAAKLLLGVDA